MLSDLLEKKEVWNQSKSVVNAVIADAVEKVTHRTQLWKWLH